MHLSAALAAAGVSTLLSAILSLPMVLFGTTAYVVLCVFLATILARYLYPRMAADLSVVKDSANAHESPIELRSRAIEAVQGLRVHLREPPGVAPAERLRAVIDKVDELRRLIPQSRKKASPATRLRFLSSLLRSCAATRRFSALWQREESMIAALRLFKPTVTRWVLDDPDLLDELEAVLRKGERSNKD